MRFFLDRKNVQPNQWAMKVNLATEYGVKKVAEALRDDMRRAYDKSIHQTEYSIYSGGGSSLRNFIVVSDKWVMNNGIGEYTVGAKKNQVIGHQLIEEVFRYMDQGTGIYSPNAGSRDLWVFELEGARANNSDTGYWVTRGQKGKGFITDVAQKFAGTEFQTVSRANVGPMVDLALGGKF